MALDVAAARAAVGQAALARDEEALRALADSLPALAAYGYERHRARAFANAIRGARDSAVAELCLGVAACPPAASTFVADSAQLRLLTGEGVPPASAAVPPRERIFARATPRVLLSGAALAAAVAALAVLPARTFDDGDPEAADVTAPARPQVVIAAPHPPAPAVSPRRPPAAVPAQGDEGRATLVSATVPAAAPRRVNPSPRPAAVARPRPRPRPEPAAPTPAQPPAQPPEPSPPATEPAPASVPAVPAAPATAISPAATSQVREPNGKALGRANAPGQLKKVAAPPEPAASAVPALEAPVEEAPPAHAGRGQGHDEERGRRP